jgi:hypothetical protein
MFKKIDFESPKFRFYTSLIALIISIVALVSTILEKQ